MAHDPRIVDDFRLEIASPFRLTMLGIIAAFIIMTIAVFVVEGRMEAQAAYDACVDDSFLWLGWGC